MFDIGFQELLIIFIVALLVFGPKRLPELAKTLGKWVVEIKKGVNTARMQIESELRVDEFKKPDEDIIKSFSPEAAKTDLTQNSADNKEAKE